MTLNTRTKTLIASVITLVVAYTAFYYFNAQLFFDESLDVAKGSHEYDLLISESIKTMPVMEGAAIGTINYHYSAGDGNKPQSDSLTFETSKPVTEVLQYYSQYLQSKGYGATQPENVTPNNVIYGSTTEVFNVFVEQAGANNRVTIYHVEAQDALARTK